ncbi:MAG: hypothetical protein L0Z50_35095 [Verrucomicrobiales bacterium]|nr:hypothetical protein [Verrucomicrobiales bacterium]
MIERSSKRSFAARPGDPDAWVRRPEPSALARNARELFTARLTIDITLALRGRIKIAAFQRGQSVTGMLRDLLAREFPDIDGGPS